MARIVVALGGNALSENGKASAFEQQEVAKATASKLTSLILAGHEIVIVHGNGPQIGNIILHEEAINTKEVPTMPMDTCSAMSQGQIGYWLQNAFYNYFSQNNIRESISTIVTQVLVDENDPAFKNPTKPIGPFYDENKAKELAETKGISVKEDAGRGWRKVVPSPKPKAIVELDIIKALISSGKIVIAAGGGGIPVIEKDDSLVGIEAVIDKDFAAAILADAIDADILLILTAIDFVKINFNQPDEFNIKEINLVQAKQYIEDGHFAPGSMLPKIEASVQFVEKQKNRVAIISSLANPLASISGNTGTAIKNS